MIMGFISTLIDIVLHLDKYLSYIVQHFGTWTYMLLFIIIFCETGLVITPFFPGDSLIFAAGTFAAVGIFNVFILFVVLAGAAVLGDTANYWIGSYLGAAAVRKYPRVFRKKYMDKTHHFYDKYGNKTIILARFVPVVRTFAPFLAGVGKMNYWKFLVYNVIGGVLWVAIALFAGFFFGNIAFVKNNFTLVIIIVIFASFLPVVFEILRHKHKERKMQRKKEQGIK